MNTPHSISPDQIAQQMLGRPVTRPAGAAERTLVETARRVSFRFGLSGLRWGDEGPAVLMLHGWGGRPGQFAGLVSPLLAAGRQVIALDAPAHGESPGDRATLIEFVAALQEAAVEVRNLESVVGHSMGAAAVALALADGLHADRAVLFAPPSSIERQLRSQAHRFGLGTQATARLIALLEQANGAPVARFEIPGRLDGVHIPALIFHDRGDREVAFDEGVRVAGAWPGARLIATEGLGHNRLLFDAAVIEQATKFLEGQEARIH